MGQYSRQRSDKDGVTEVEMEKECVSELRGWAGKAGPAA